MENNSVARNINDIGEEISQMFEKELEKAREVITKSYKEFASNNQSANFEYLVENLKKEGKISPMVEVQNGVGSRWIITSLDKMSDYGKLIYAKVVENWRRKYEMVPFSKNIDPKKYENKFVFLRFQELEYPAGVLAFHVTYDS